MTIIHTEAIFEFAIEVRHFLQMRKVFSSHAGGLGNTTDDNQHGADLKAGADMQVVVLKRATQQGLKRKFATCRV